MLKWTLVFLAGALLGANAVYYLMTRDSRPREPLAVERRPSPAPPPAVSAERSVPPSASPRPVDSEVPSPGPAAAPGARETRAVPPRVSTAPAVQAPSGLVVPVRGIAASQLSNTFDDARGDGRVHEALDIMAPRGTPVIAVSDGHIEKLFYSEQGGLTLYQFDPASRFAYYYAHLDRYAPGLVEGKPLRRGELIGYVGSTGNADMAAPHLHFAVFELGPEKQWWKGRPINPYPLLGGG